MKFNDGKKEYDIDFEEIDNWNNGIVQAGFTLNVSKPFNAECRFTDGDVGTKQGVNGINFYKSSAVALAASAAAGAKKQSVLFSLTDEALNFIKTESKKGMEAIKTRAKQIEIKSWSYALGGDTHNLYISTDDIDSLEMHFRDDLKEIRDYIMKNDGKVTIEFLREHSKKIERNTALYTVNGYREISNRDFMEIYSILRAEDAEKQTQKNDKKDAMFAEAASTGERQILRQWSEECNDPREECDIDNIIQYAMPDGTTKTERYHTW